MWPGQQQPPNGEHTPQGGQPHPYAQQPYPPTVAEGAVPHPAGTPQPRPRGSAGTGTRTTTVVAVAGAAVVVAAAGVTGYLLLGGKEKPGPRPGPTVTRSSPSVAPDDRAAGTAARPVVPGWKVVVNAKRGIAFDVPPEWDRKPASWVSYVSDERDPEDTPLIGFAAPAILKEQWCRSDDEKDGNPEDTPLASAGSRNEKDAETPEEAARKSVELWVYGAYAQPDRSKVKVGPVRPYTTASGLKGAVATASSTGASGPGKCDTDGTATTFAFTSPKGDILSWTYLAARGVPDQVPEATVRRILATVRLTAESP
ncbi:hypothetical protein ACFPM3_08950 [Streptomyces coeruleoprunus]|uniref:DUF8017 domain-containing protein n=1 Tax=Streptomyces coeruleoprunus TaxID=285563 RepID=A0ABV9XCU1_9ACTN